MSALSKLPRWRFMVQNAMFSILVAWVGLAGPCFAQTNLSDASTINESMQAKLMRRGSLTLRDASLIEALFAIRDNWDINIVVRNDVEGEINGAYTDAPLHEILDSILLTNGFGYRPIGNSLVIMKLEDVGDIKPLFKTAIIPLQEGTPEELKDLIQSLLSPNGKAHAIPSSNSLVVLDYPDRIQLIRERIEELAGAARGVRERFETRQREQEATAAAQAAAGGADAQDGSGDAQGPAPPRSPQVVTAYYAPQFINAVDLQESLQQLVSEAGTVTVVAAENRIVAADYPDYIARITDAVEKLDVPRTQVRISAYIYDCSLEDIQRLGVNWQHAMKSNNLDATGLAQDQWIINSLTAASPTAAAANGAMTFMSMGGNFDVSAAVNALSQSSNSKLLADPNVVVVDRESALISIVTEIPYQQLTEGLEGGSIGTTAFREAGVKMEVTPHVARDGTVSMVVTPSFSVLSGFTEEDNQPIIDRREATTTVRVANNQTLVIGGLRQKTQVHDFAGIPVLQDLWGVGNLFKHQTTTVRESELVVFLTPTIISPHTFGTEREKSAHRYSECQLNGIPLAPDCPCPETYPGQNVILPNTHDSVYVEDIVVPQPASPNPGNKSVLPGDDSSRRELETDEQKENEGSRTNTTRIRAADPKHRTARNSLVPPPLRRSRPYRSSPAPSGRAEQSQAQKSVPRAPSARPDPRLSRLPTPDPVREAMPAAVRVRPPAAKQQRLPAVEGSASAGREPVVVRPQFAAPPRKDAPRADRSARSAATLKTASEAAAPKPASEPKSNRESLKAYFGF